MTTSHRSETSLSGRTALVTGGARGIGRAIAVHLAQYGADVAISYHKDQAGAEETVGLIEDDGGNSTAFQADLSTGEAAHSLVNGVVEQYGKLDILVCNAGVAFGNLVALQDAREWQYTMSVNVIGPAMCVQAAIPGMIASRRGSVILLSSHAAARGVTGLVSYSASKGAVDSMVRSLAVELGRKGIRVNAVAPGLVDTEMLKPVSSRAINATLKRVALRRLGKVDEIATVVRFLASDEASFVSGQVISVNGGFCD